MSELDELIDELIAGAVAITEADAVPVPVAATQPMAAQEQIPGLITEVYYRSTFIDKAYADYLFEVLQPGGAAMLPWARRAIPIGIERRATAFYGDVGATYRYSGRDNVALPWSADPTSCLAQLCAFASATTGFKYNLVLCNWYEPADCIGAHSDDERDLVPEAGIFSISLGCPRRFDFIPKREGVGKQVSIRLQHGSVVWMAGKTQAMYKHEIAVEKRAAGGRVNLTFRCVRV